MNRENKRKQFEKGYYKTHPCRDSFTCKVCGRLVTPEGAGTSHRNHCPNCLSSLHMDEEPGDRASDCGGVMEPIAVWVRKNGEWAVVHRCRRCGKLSSNRVAADDNPMKLMSIAMRPVAQPPFPLAEEGARPESPPPLRPLRQAVREYERGLIQRALEAAGGNVSRAAQLLEIPRQTLCRRIQEYGLRSGGRRSS